jgi:zinc protease
MPNAIPGPQDIVRHVLPNGIVVLARENFDAQSVVVNGVLTAGAIHESPEKSGLASITAEALMRGTQSYSFEALHEILEGNGMSLEFNGGRHSVSFGGKALAEDLPTLLALMGDILHSPTFPENHLELIKNEVVTGLRYSEQDTRYRANKAFQQLAYPANHIYARGSNGEIPTVQALTRADVQDFHARFYGPKGMILVIVGAVKAEEAVKTVEKVFGAWENPRQPDFPADPDIPSLEQINLQVVTLAGKSQSDIVLGVVGPSRFSPDYQAARLANNILGVFGMMGRLGASVREEKGLAYYCSSSVEGGTGRGAWRISAGVNPSNVRLALESIRVEIQRMWESPVSPQDLADNQANLILRLPLLLETNGGVAGQLMNMERFNLGLDYLQRYPDLINSLTAADLQQAMQKYWHPQAFNAAIAGPALAENPL